MFVNAAEFPKTYSDDACDTGRVIPDERVTDVVKVEELLPETDNVEGKVIPAPLYPSM